MCTYVYIYIYIYIYMYICTIVYITSLARASSRGISVRDGQFSSSRKVSVHVEPAAPTSAVSLLTSSSSSASSFGDFYISPGSGELAPMRPLMMRPGILSLAQVLDAAIFMHHHH